MSVYNWEQSAHAGHKKAKKTGTVILHKDEGVDTSFARLRKPIAVERAGGGGGGAGENAESSGARTIVKTPLMTEATVQALQAKMGFTALLPCQAQCYRGIFNGRDVVLHSRTGSGKTLAYALPIIERHLLLESGTRHATEGEGEQKEEGEEGAATAVLPVASAKEEKSASQEQQHTRDGPFLAIFVFSNELAVQTRDVLAALYPTLRLFVAGVDEMPHCTPSGKEENEEGAHSVAVVDIIIGTVAHIDRALRGKVNESQHEENSSKEDDEDEDESDDEDDEVIMEKAEDKTRTEKAGASRKRAREAITTPSGTNKKLKKATAAAKKEDGEARQQQQKKTKTESVSAAKTAATTTTTTRVGEDTTKETTADTPSLISAANIRAVVIDEVDTTLGPRFTNIGRRMKNLLKFIRKANGSLTEGLLHDYRRHHYVLCGATIPNWVIKAGFLGVKKYYYELVAVGTEKLPATLDCLELACPREQRVSTAAALLRTHTTFLGRVIVFGTERQLSRLEQTLQANDNNNTNNTKAALVARTVMGSRPESARMAAIEAYNRREANVLLCTDLAARGLDFIAVDTVLMLSLPGSQMATETFVHRAGRTARVGRPGRCLVLHDETERDVMDGIAKAAHVVFRPFRLATQEGAGNKTQKSKEKTESVGQQADMVCFALTVRNPFRFTSITSNNSNSKAAQVPSARAVLEKQLSPALRAALQDVRERAKSNGEVVEFAVPLAHATELRGALWKYDLKELPRPAKKA